MHLRPCAAEGCRKLFAQGLGFGWEGYGYIAMKVAPQPPSVGMHQVLDCVDEGKGGGGRIRIKKRMSNAQISYFFQTDKGSSMGSLRQSVIFHSTNTTFRSNVVFFILISSRSHQFIPPLFDPTLLLPPHTSHQKTPSTTTSTPKLP